MNRALSSSCAELRTPLPITYASLPPDLPRNLPPLASRRTFAISLLMHFVMPPVAASTAPCALDKAACADALLPILRHALAHGRYRAPRRGCHGYCKPRGASRLPSRLVRTC